MGKSFQPTSERAEIIAPTVYPYPNITDALTNQYSICNWKHWGFDTEGIEVFAFAPAHGQSQIRLGVLVWLNHHDQWASPSPNISRNSVTNPLTTSWVGSLVPPRVGGIICTWISISTDGNGLTKIGQVNANRMMTRNCAGKRPLAWRSNWRFRHTWVHANHLSNSTAA